jgi:DNA repair exonuclease SbcCD ATPase subunit
MLVFRKIRYKNFLSTGAQFTEIDFEKNRTNILIGKNGYGKSSVIDAITFALFNKAFRNINKNQLVNSINERDCLVEIEFSVNNREYLVRRGIKPNIFDIEVDGNLLRKESDERINQKILENNILKVNFKSFTQLVILGSSTYVPFMQLNASNRREVIEDLLDIRIFSTMNSLIKDKIKTKKDQIKSLQIQRSNLEEKIKMQEEFIEELENRGNANITTNKQKISDLDHEISDYMSHISVVEEDLRGKDKLQQELIGAGDRLLELNNLKGKITQKVTTITEEHKFFTENTVCPTCTQNIEDEFRLNRITDAKNKAKELHKGFQELEATIKLEQERERQFTVLSKEITKLNHEISQNNTRISLNQRQIRDLESEVQTITEQLKNRNTEHEKLESFKNNLEKTTEDLLEKKEKIVYYDFAHSLLKDDGVKTKIIKKYLPFINQQVNRYLQLMDFYINFEFDSEFNESIKSPIHEKYSYSSFSEGEKAKINLSLVFAWREVAKAKNSINCNLLIFDEIFDSSLDEFGTDNFLKIIRYVINDANIFVISHKDGIQDKFERVIKFDKRNEFSYKTEA